VLFYDKMKKGGIVVNEFYKVLNYVNENLYQPNRLLISDVKEEVQNSEYGAGVFQLNEKLVRFRVAKITPNKTGQFVVFWEKDKNGKNQAFSYEKAPDLLVINTFTEHKFGQFVFPKEILIKQNILKTTDTKGKMAMRVYPGWEKPISKQAIKTQKWQLDYFIEIDDTNNFPVQELLQFYVN